MLFNITLIGRTQGGLFPVAIVFGTVPGLGPHGVPVGLHTVQLAYAIVILVAGSEQESSNNCSSQRNKHLLFHMALFLSAIAYQQEENLFVPGSKPKVMPTSALRIRHGLATDR